MKKEVDISLDEILIKYNIINFRDENAQIKTSVNSQRAHVILKKKRSIFFPMGIFLGQIAPSPGSDAPAERKGR